MFSMIFNRYPYLKHEIDNVHKICISPKSQVFCAWKDINSITKPT